MLYIILYYILFITGLICNSLKSNDFVGNTQREIHLACIFEMIICYHNYSLFRSSEILRNIDK